MRRIISAVIILTFAAFTAMADAQADFNRYIQAYNSYLSAKQYTRAAQSALEASRICSKAKNYDGGFKLLQNLDNALAAKNVSADSLPQPFYFTAKGRFELYRHMGNDDKAEGWLKKMGTYAKTSPQNEIKGDMLFTEAQFYYATNRNKLGDECLERLIDIYDRGSDSQADTAYQRLINEAVALGDAKLVDHTYEQYMQWADSVEAANADSELVKVKEEMAETEAEMQQKQHTINSRTSLMVVFITLFVIAVAALGLGALFYWRALAKNRRIRRQALEAEQRNAAKSAMLQNMSSTLEPALNQLDPDNPAVQSLKGYVKKVGELSEVDSAPAPTADALEDVNIEQMASRLADQVRPELARGVTLRLDGTKGFAKIDRDGVEKILAHLLHNSARFTPMGGKITLAFRKRGATSYQFIISNDGPSIPEQERETIFQAFGEKVDITEGGDRLGLPICALRAEKMGGSLTLDPTVTKGVAFVLSLK